MKKSRALLEVLFTPGCWIQIHDYSPAWDIELNLLMEADSFWEIGRYTAKIGGVEVWIANHPYGSFSQYGPGAWARPRRSTILRAMRKLERDRMVQRRAERGQP